MGFPVMPTIGNGMLTFRITEHAGRFNITVIDRKGNRWDDIPNHRNFDRRQSAVDYIKMVYGNRVLGIR